MVAAVHFYASDSDMDALLDFLRVGAHVALRQWPRIDAEPVIYSRSEAMMQRNVIIVSDDFGEPVGIGRNDPATLAPTLSGFLNRRNLEASAHDDLARIVDLDASPVLFWTIGRSGPQEFGVSSLGSQATSMAALSPDYERWVNRAMGWVRRRGTPVWGLRKEQVRPDLRIDLSIVSTIYALPHALRLLEAGATGGA